MFRSWRLQLKEAEQALREGRLEDAGRLLRQGALLEFLPAQKLQARLAEKLVERGRAQLKGGETLAGWHDLETASELGADDNRLGTLRHELAERSLDDVVRFLAAGEIDTALSRLDRLASHDALSSRARRLRQVALKLRTARRMKDAGRFVLAEAEISSAAALAPDESFLSDALETCRAQAAIFRRLSQQLYAHLTDADFNQALAVAEQMLADAPNYRPALDARRQAWEAVGMELTASGVGRAAAGVGIAGSNGTKQRMALGEASSAMGTRGEAREKHPRGRFVLWIDAVGGYLVCRGDKITIGQPVPGHSIDVPILGDVSRIHAVIRRDGEGYLLDPVRPTKVDGRTATGVAPLVDGRVIELGGGVKLRFRRPHPLSATARLEMVSGHRTQPPVDGILLMADSCILGPGATSHVTCPDWTREVVLFGRGEALELRTEGNFEIDGVAREGRGRLEANSHVVSEDFSLSLETI